ncbi:MAG: hypothetical protein V1494_05680 [Candidatus Diapherotrites archaeon]
MILYRNVQIYKSFAIGYELTDEVPESRVALLWNGSTKKLIDSE